MNSQILIFYHFPTLTITNVISKQSNQLVSKFSLSLNARESCIYLFVHLYLYTVVF